MKTATIPPLRVTPDLRQAAESVLHEGETLSGLVEHSLRLQIDIRRSQQAFIERGLAARDEAKATGQYLSKAEVMASLQKVIDKHRRKR